MAICKFDKSVTHGRKNHPTGAVETLGGLHAVAVEQMKELGSALARQTGQEEGDWGRQKGTCSSACHSTSCGQCGPAGEQEP